MRKLRMTIDISPELLCELLAAKKAIGATRSKSVSRDSPKINALAADVSIALSSASARARAEASKVVSSEGLPGIGSGG